MSRFAAHPAHRSQKSGQADEGTGEEQSADEPVPERNHQLTAGAPIDAALARARTTAVTGAVLLQVLYLLACRSLTRPNAEIGHWSNPSICLGIGLVLILQSAFIALPAMNATFGSTPLDARQIVWPAASGLLVLPLTWILERSPDRHGRGACRHTER